MITVDRQTDYDVNVIGAFKSYGENNVLNGLNMSVPSCTIYGLLGPSGCGKSTLLQCILGTVTLDSGRIDLNVECLKDIGYMPQNLCLEEILTVRETFEYYGALYNMSSKDINSRIDELDKFLKLPKLDSYIKDISGGQSRRVSLAISLLHNPKVIILDEPTVGVDPVIRQKIWDEFTKLVEQHQRTIIITTHYIEEANQANRIGLMRYGILIDEESPKNILTKYGTDSLEASFLKLCCAQETNQIIRNRKKIEDKTKPKQLKNFENNVEFYRIKALLKKYCHLCFRDYLLIFTLVLLPILQIINFCLCIGVHFKGMSIAVKNDEVSLINCQYSNVDGCIFDEDNNQTMSCVILYYLALYEYTLVEVKDHEAGVRSMNNSNYMAFLYFPKHFTSDLVKYVDNRESFNDKSQTYAQLTNENFLFRNQIKTDVLNSINYLIEKTLNGCAYNPKMAGVPLRFQTLFGHEVKSYGNSVVSFFIAMQVFYFPSMFAVSVMMSEKMDGILSRSMFAGVKVIELVISIFFICTILLFTQMFFICFVSFVIFHHPIQMTNGLFVYALIMYIVGCIGFLFGLVTAVLSSSKLGGTNVVIMLSMSQFLLSGIFWPLEGQPQFLRNVSKFLPVRLAGNTMNNIALKGWSLDHPSIVIGTTTIFAYIIVLVLVLIVLGKLKKDLWVLKNK